MNKKLISILGAVIAGTVLLTACGGGNKAVQGQAGKVQNVDKKSSEVIKAEHPEKNPDAAKNRKDTLVVSCSVPAGKFNPILTDSNDDSWVCAMMFDGLLSNDKQGNMVPWVAEKWDISQDGKTYTFHLRKDVKFSDGSNLTADDVAFTYTAMADPSYDGARVDAVNQLVGYKEYNKGDAKTVEGIKVIDPYTISFTFTDVYAPALANNFGYGILSKKYYGFEKGNVQKLKDLFLKPMGSGAFKFKEYKTGQEIDFEKNPSYFKGEPKIKNLVMKVTNGQTIQQELKSGGVDITEMIAAKPENIGMMKEAGFLDLQLFPENAYGFIGFNLRNDMFKDKKVRQALTYGFNRKAFVDAYFKGYADVCNNPIPHISWAYSDDVNKYEFNPDKANQLLEEAGWKKNADGFRYKDGKKFTIHWMCNTGSKYIDAIIPVVQQNWKALGVDVVPELLEFATMTDKVGEKRDFEMYTMMWITGLDPDPSAQYCEAQDQPGGFNSVGFRNEENEKLLQEGVKTTDKEKRKEIYAKWAKLVADEAPYILVDQDKKMYVVNSRVKNVDLSPYQDWTYFAYKAELAQ